MFLSTDTSQQTHYSRVPTISRQRNAFSIAKPHKTTIQFDKLFPMYTKYIYPGDTLAIQQHVMARLQTQVSDLFDDLYFDLHAWFVPMRLIHDNWARFQFNTQTTPGQDNSALTTPKIDFNTLPSGKFPAKSLFDYLGYPTLPSYLAASPQHINNYPARAYVKIWNESYRDENLQAPIALSTGDGPDDYIQFPLLKRGQRHNKFTSALPFLQKGTPSTVPVLGAATVTPDVPNAAPVWGITNNSSSNNYGIITGNTADSAGFSPTPGATGTVYWKDPNLLATFSQGLAFMLVNDLRVSVSVQHLLEADARGGTRDVESIKHRWGVTVPDFRLQRPEYLGGQTFTFDGVVVPSTAATDDNPQGHLTSFSQTMNTFNVTHSFVEHGIFMILLSCRSNLTYQQMLPREFTYKTRYDFYQPEFGNIGEVAMLNREIFATGNDSVDQAAFGYQEYGYWLRYDEGMVTSEMRSEYAQSLDYKHMAFDYVTTPVLNDAFIQSSTPIDRNIVVASGTADPIQINSIVKGTIARTLPMYSVPGLMRL